MKTTTIRIDEQTQKDIQTVRNRMRFATDAQAIRWALSQIAGNFEDDAYREKLQRERSEQRARRPARPAGDDDGKE